MRVSPTVSAPKISARCEIDLSPGTRARPLRAPARRAVSGDLAAWSTDWLGFAQASTGPKGRHPGRHHSGAVGPRAAWRASRLAAIDTATATRQPKHLLFDPLKEPAPSRTPRSVPTASAATAA